MTVVENEPTNPPGQGSLASASANDLFIENFSAQMIEILCRPPFPSSLLVFFFLFIFGRKSPVIVDEICGERRYRITRQNLISVFSLSQLVKVSQPLNIGRERERERKF